MRGVVFVMMVLTVLCGGRALSYAGQMILVSSTSFDGGADDESCGVVTDGEGNVIVAGYSQAGTVPVFLIRKYDAGLRFVSSATFSDGHSDTVSALARDSSGNIIVTGSSFDVDSSFLTVKYDNDLRLLDSVTLAGGYGKGVATDGAGNIIVTGEGGEGCLTVKYDRDLTMISSATCSGAGAAVAVDGTGNIVVAGSVCNGVDNDLLIVRYDADLQFISSTTCNCCNHDEAKGVAVDGGGNIIVTGLSGSADGLPGAVSHASAVTLVYDADLRIISRATYDNGDYASGSGVAIGDRGYIFVTGDAGRDGFLTIRYDSDLRVISSATYENSLNDGAVAVALDKWGNIITAGHEASLTLDWMILKYLGAPTATSLSPDSIRRWQTIDVTVTGSNFGGGCHASFGPGITVNSVRRVSSEQIVVNITAAAPAAVGGRTVTVTNTDGLSCSLTPTFTVEEMPLTDSAGVDIDPLTGGVVPIRPESGEIVVEVPGGAFENVVSLMVSTAAVPVSTQDTIVVTNLGIEITAGEGLQPSKEIAVTVSYRDSDIANFDESKLTLARYDAVHRRWIPFPTVVYASENRMVGTVRHLSTFAVVQLAPAADLAGVKVYPNPFLPSNGLLTIADLTGEAEIRIYTVAGELVRTLDYASADGRTTWNGKNDGGSDVASGVYLALIKSGAGKKIVKIAVER